MPSSTDVEPSRAIRQAEVGATRTMIDRTQDRFGLYPERLAADSAYGSAENLAWLVHERGIEPHIPVFDKSQRQDGTFERADFSFDHAADAYTCPAGKPLRQRQKTYRDPRPLVDEDGMLRYRASKFDCDPVRAEAAVLSEHARAQDDPLDPRRRPRHGPRHRHHGRLRHLAPRAKEGRDAVRAPQTHPQARPTATTRSERRPRRVPPRRHRPEPTQARQAHPLDRAGSPCLSDSGPRKTAIPLPLAPVISGLFQRYRPKAKVGFAPDSRPSDLGR